MRYVGLGRDNLRSHFVFRPRHAPRVTLCSIPPGRFSHKRRRTDRKDFYHVPHPTNLNTYVKFIFLRTSPLTFNNRFLLRATFRPGNSGLLQVSEEGPSFQVKSSLEEEEEHTFKSSSGFWESTVMHSLHTEERPEIGNIVCLCV